MDHYDQVRSHYNKFPKGLKECLSKTAEYVLSKSDVSDILDTVDGHNVPKKYIDEHIHRVKCMRAYDMKVKTVVSMLLKAGQFDAASAYSTEENMPPFIFRKILDNREKVLVVEGTINERRCVMKWCPDRPVIEEFPIYKKMKRAGAMVPWFDCTYMFWGEPVLILEYMQKIGHDDNPYVFGKQILKQLSIMHALGIVHSDIKPGNVMRFPMTDREAYSKSYLERKADKGVKVAHGGAGAPRTGAAKAGGFVFEIESLEYGDEVIVDDHGYSVALPYRPASRADPATKEERKPTYLKDVSEGDKVETKQITVGTKITSEPMYSLLDFGGVSTTPLGKGFRRKIWTRKWTSQDAHRYKQVTTAKNDFLELGFAMTAMYEWVKADETISVEYSVIHEGQKEILKRYIDYVHDLPDDHEVARHAWKDLCDILDGKKVSRKY